MLLIVIVMDVRKHGPLLSVDEITLEVYKYESGQKEFGYRRHEVNAHL
jgi:hypothetical protein